jgi:uncharacterized protein (TIGR01777 family)
VTVGNEYLNKKYKMKAAITGITGFVGNRLKEHLESLKWIIVPLRREDIAKESNELSMLIDGCDVIINLAGAPILNRHTVAYRKIVYDSRILTTQKVVNAIKLLDNQNPLFISASAVGIYSDIGVNTESSFGYANDFMAQVCNDWEQAALEAKSITSVAIVRMGIVLDKKEGALQQMLLPFKLGVGGKIGTGKQMFSWIHIHDLINAYMFVINSKRSGVYNFTSPGYLNNDDFTKILAKTLNRPAFFTVPEFALKLLYGSGAETITSSHAVYPERLLNEGFEFKFPIIENALEDILL